LQHGLVTKKLDDVKEFRELTWSFRQKSCSVTDEQTYGQNLYAVHGLTMRTRDKNN